MQRLAYPVNIAKVKVNTPQGPKDFWVLVIAPDDAPAYVYSDTRGKAMLYASEDAAEAAAQELQPGVLA